MSNDTVITATLVRGKTYKVFHKGAYETFERGVEREVDEELADQIELEVEQISTEDGDVIERDRFNIDRDASPRKVQPEGKRLRKRIITEEVDIAPRKRVPLRKAPSAKTTGFKPRRAG